MATHRTLSNRRHPQPLRSGASVADGIDRPPCDTAHWPLRITGSWPRMPPTLYAYIWQNSRRGQVVLCVLTVLVSFLTALPLELQRRIVDDAVPARSLTL